MRYSITIICTLALLFQSQAQSQWYSEVEITLSSFEEIETLAQKGYDIDHYQGNINDGIRFMVTQSELASLREEGYTMRVTIPNYQEFYSAIQQADRAAHPNPIKVEGVAAGFDLGSMGGFYTFNEVVDKLDEMKANFPHLISAKSSIGSTEEGRDIWMVKISDNPEVAEDEPSVHFDALHHAREPLSMATTINFMFWLLENYETDASIQFLINNRELYFVPVVNPDGYVYNETTHPEGGGLWRKNRNPNLGGCVGVDLNRNYGFGYATNNSCSSPDPCSGIYRGPEAFSEVESTAIRDLLAITEANTAFSTHSTAGTYLMPYGFDTSPPAFDIYSEWASAFLDENDYSYGVTFQMLGYTSCGTTRDYMHSEGIYGWTPEIGGSGFWPPESTIFDLVAENVRPFLFQSYIAGGYLDVQSYELIGAAVPGGNFELIVEVKNIGVGATAQNVSVVVQTNSGAVISPTASAFGDIPARQRKDNSEQPFQFSIDPQFQGGSFTIIVTTIQDGIPNESFEIPIVIGEQDILFEDNAEGGEAQWSSYGTEISWGINQDDSFSGVQCFGDSANGNSANNTENYFELNETFNFEGLNSPLVQFAYKHSLIGNDRAFLEVSTNDGVDWFPIKTYQQNKDWTIEAIDLSNYTELTSVKFRFTMVTDGSRPGDGFYFDDFKVIHYTEGILDVWDDTRKNTTIVYPNPFSETIIIQHSLSEKYAALKLFDVYGKQMAMEYVEGPGFTKIVNIGSLQSGIYFLQLKEEITGEIRVHRVLKE